MIEEVADRFAITELIYLERHWRDKGEWDKMKTLYYPESQVRVAWFSGTGPDFVEASRGIHREGQSKHRLSPSVVQIYGNRGVAETDTVIETRTWLGDVEIDTAAYCRLLSRVRKDNGVWRLSGLDCIYEKDTIQTIEPSQHLEIDTKRLQSYRPSYRWLCYNLEALGRPINANLPGDDRKDLVEALYREVDEWLKG